MKNTNSDSPRTDAVRWFQESTVPNGVTEAVPADFTRTLERELTEARAEVERLTDLHVINGTHKANLNEVIATLRSREGKLVGARDRMLNVARGCRDYGGGYRGDDKAMEIYQHGISTVIRALEAHLNNPADTQTLALERVALLNPDKEST